MFLYVTGTVRCEIDQYDHGRIAKIDWNTKEVVKRLDRVFPVAFCSRNSNPRGGTRGWRGLIQDPNSDGIIIANNDSLVYFTKNLEYKKVVTHPAFGNIHALSIVKGMICISSTLNDTYCLYDGDNIKVIEPLADKKIYDLVKDWLIIRGRDRKPYDPNKDYREEWIEDTLHLNYVQETTDKRILVEFNSMNLLLELEPNLKILYQPDILLGSIEPQPNELGLQCPHNIVIENENSILINSSARMELYRFLLKENELELIWKYDEKDLGWNRGLAINNNHAFIGTGNGTIIEIDLESKKEVDRLKVFDSGKDCSVFEIFVSET